jgi:DNA-binding transcriptional LysR family regulator
LNREVLRLCQRAGFTPHISQEAIQLHVVVSLVSAGIGIAIVPASTQLLPVPNVVYRPLAEQDGEVHIAVVYRAKDPSPIVKEFVKVARQVFSRHLPAGKRRDVATLSPASSPDTDAFIDPST